MKSNLDIAGMSEFEFPVGRTMTAEAVVEASLAGLEIGEVVCVPGLEDGSLLARLMELLQSISDSTMSSSPQMQDSHFEY